MIQFTQGDAVVLNLQAQDGNGNPINLTGAVITTMMVGPGGVIVSFPNSQHTVNPDQVNFEGDFTLTLANTDTQLVDIGGPPLNSAPKDILSYIVIGSTPIYYRGQGILTVLPPVPLR